MEGPNKKLLHFLLYDKWKNSSFCALQGAHTPSFNFFPEILDLGPPFNFPAYYRSLILMSNVALSTVYRYRWKAKLWATRQYS